MSGGNSRRGSSAQLEGHHMALLLLGAGALLVSGGTLVAMHLLLQWNKQRRRSTDGKDTPVEEEDLALVLSEEEEMGGAEDRDDEQPQQPPQHAEATQAKGRDWTEARGERLSRRARLRRRKEKLVGPHIETFPQQERGKMMVSIGLRRKEDSAVANEKCNVCWLFKRHCICAQLPLLDLPLDFVVLLHYKEYLRISNTGHLLPLMHKHDPATDTGSELLIRGTEASDARLAALEAQAQAEPYSVIALMPTEDAITLPDLVRRRQEAGMSEGRLKVILLDGTWRQGRALNRRLSPHVTRVKLQVLDRPSQFRLRRRTRPDGICTIEAAALAVLELAEQRGERYDGVIQALELLNRTVLASTKRPPKDDHRGQGTTRRAPLPPLRQQVAGGGLDDSLLLYEDAQSSVGDDGEDMEEEEEEDDGLVVFESPEKGLLAFEDSRESASPPEPE